MAFNRFQKENSEKPEIAPFEIKEGTYPIYCSFFFQAGLTILFDPLLVDYLRRTRFQLGQLTLIVIRVILGVAELNRRFDLHLDFDDLRYCYGLIQGKDDGKWAVRARTRSPSLVEALGDSHKYSYDDIVIIKGNVEPNPKNYPVPRQFGSPGG